MIEKILADTSMDTEQEFMKGYTSGTDSIFGSLSEEDEFGSGAPEGSTVHSRYVING